MHSKDSTLNDLLTSRLTLLDQPEHRELLAASRFGLEKEGLRVDGSGRLAATSHPAALGSALTNSRITTDYAEALLEFITSPHPKHEGMLAEMADIHRFATAHLPGDEVIWNQSMPARLPADADIAIGWYGTSHTGMLKHVYRRGLALRYGKAMQCIAGIHYNFSFGEALWPLLEDENAPTAERDPIAHQSARYVALIRNFTRYSWLLMYLFGASPALHAGFLRGRPHALETFDADTLYLPHATSLRMSDLGYQNKAQSALAPCYNDLSTYLQSLFGAVSQSWPEYEKYGTIRDGEWVQLNTNVLQIENEYYSSIRPKRVAQRGERPLRALAARGIQYLEVRCLDIDPFVPVGIELETSRFLEIFLLYCALERSAPFVDNGRCRRSANNFGTVVKAGRQPGLMLEREGEPVSLRAWGGDLLNRFDACADLLDRVHGGGTYRAAVAAQRVKLDEPDATPSARLLAGMREQGASFIEYSLAQSRAHADALRAQSLPEATQAAFVAQAAASLAEQARIEAADTGDFASYVARYESGLGALASAA